MILDILHPLSAPFSLMPCRFHSAFASYIAQPLISISCGGAFQLKANSFSVLDRMHEPLMLSNTSLAFTSVAKFSVMNMNSRHRSRIDDGNPEPCGVGRKVHNAIMGYAIHDDLGVLAGCFEGDSPGGTAGGFWKRTRWWGSRRRVTMDISPTARTWTS